MGNADRLKCQYSLCSLFPIPLPSFIYGETNRLHVYNCNHTAKNIKFVPLDAFLVIRITMTKIITANSTSENTPPTIPPTVPRTPGPIYEAKN